ncbi:hypothetical protein ACFSHQ_25035 [Gemmobacter lanyuensis]
MDHFHYFVPFLRIAVMASLRKLSFMPTAMSSVTPMMRFDQFRSIWVK